MSWSMQAVFSSESGISLLYNLLTLASKWKWPAIPNREHFQGQMLHSASWDDSIQLQGKRVGVIGSGSSAVQIVPNIQPGLFHITYQMHKTDCSVVSSLKCFIRSQSWVTASFGQRFAGKGGTNFKCEANFCTIHDIYLTTPDSEKQKEILRSDPEKYLAYRKKIESELNSRFRFILNGSKEQADARAVSHTLTTIFISNKPPGSQEGYAHATGQETGVGRSDRAYQLRRRLSSPNSRGWIPGGPVRGERQRRLLQHPGIYPERYPDHRRHGARLRRYRLRHGLRCKLEACISHHRPRLAQSQQGVV